VRAIWPVLYEFGVDVMVNGHDHDYERFALQTPTGQVDPQHGVREFVVGTGGRTYMNARRFSLIVKSATLRRGARSS
jgi:hypothetical protein